jgi:four helix bundle protein
VYAPSIGRGHGELVDQLRRASLSVPLNIAEGSGKFNKDGTRYYTIARGSALECAAILDALEALGLVDESTLRQPREKLERVVSMLTGLIRP